MNPLEHLRQDTMGELVPQTKKYRRDKTDRQIQKRIEVRYRERLAHREQDNDIHEALTARSATEYLLDR